VFMGYVLMPLSLTHSLSFLCPPLIRAVMHAGLAEW
jgi:hypothetical protein